MAQTGNSCSNPHVMNLLNGAGNAEFQFHYPDTVMYVSIKGINNKQNFEFYIDTNATLNIDRISIKNNTCSGNYIFDSEVSSNGNFVKLTSMNFANNDSILLIIYKNQYNNACNFCDTSNMNIKFLALVPGPNTCVVSTEYCDNLVINGDLEEFQPQFEQNDPNEPFPSTTGVFIFPDWGLVTMLENVTCGWHSESYVQPPGSNPPTFQTQPSYINEWFDNPTNLTICNNTMPYSIGLSYCPLIPVYGLNPIFCSPQPQQLNDFFPNSSGTDNNGFTRCYLGQANIGPRSDILRGSIAQSLQPAELYYFEVSIGAMNAETYGGLMNFDVSADQNYIQGNYQGPTPIAGIEMTVNGFDYNPTDPWKVFNTVFTAVGGESKIYAGNLGHNSFTIGIPTANSSGPYFVQHNDGVYSFDNFVVKKFFADAGPTAVTKCIGHNVQLGGNSCPFPDVIYDWQPASAFIDNTIANPICTTNVNVVCTLTISIPVNIDNGILVNPPVIVSTSSTVDITIIQGNSITITGATTVTTGGNTTLNLIDGTNFSWTGSDGSSGTTASISTGALTQDVTYTINATSSSGCSVTEIVTVTVTQLPAACISDPNYPNAILIPDGTDFSGLISLIPPLSVQTNGNNEYHINTVNFALEGKLYIDNNALVYFNNCHFACYDGAQIINTSNLTLRVCTLEACNNVLWKGILNEGKLAISSCVVRDAVDGVLIAPQTINEISGTIFTNNYRGLNIFGPCTFANSRNTFENPDPLFTHWLGWNLPRALCGINISDATLIQIDGTPTSSQLFTTFRDINCGILCQNTDLLVSNAYFENIADQFGVANNINGTAIYTQGTAAHRLRVFPLNGVNQATTFLNCATGIYHEGYNTRLDYLGMQNVTRGIVGEQLAFCTNRMEYNKINASIYGVEMNLIDDVDLFVINHNTITMNSTIARGIAVSAFSNSSSAGSNIKIQGNTIDITRGSVGIEVNSINHPKVNINVISHGLVSTSGFATTWHGVKATNCFRADISCNNLTVGAGLIPGNSGADIYVAQSQSTLVACNTTNGESPTGIFLSSGNNGSAIQTNEIGSHSIGLYLDNSCVIGPQPSPSGQPHGNRWNGVYGNATYNGAGAVNESFTLIGLLPSQFAMIPNRVIVENNSSSAFWPDNYPDNTYGNSNTFNENTDWFHKSNLLTIPLCSGGYCPAPFVDNSDDDKKSMSSINGSIAMGLIQTAGYPEETKWMLKKGLIKNLTQNDSLLNANDTLQVFYFSIDQENLKKLQFIADTVMAVKLHNQALIQTMQANDSIMLELGLAMRDLLPLLTDSSMNDSINMIMNALNQQYSIIAAVNETYSTLLIQERNNASQQSSSINAGIVPANFNEYLERKVNEIYYNSYGQGIDSLSIEDIAMLSYISHICPQAGGPSVYKARALYQLVNDTIIYNDSVVCRNVGYFRESQELLMPELQEKVKSIHFVVYPNPGNERLNMIITGNTADGVVSVYNALGALIQNINIAKESNSKEVDIINWAEGYYLIKYHTNNYQSQIKFIKVK